MSDPINWTQQRKRLADLTPWPRNPRQIVAAGQLGYNSDKEMPERYANIPRRDDWIRASHMSIVHRAPVACHRSFFVSKRIGLLCTNCGKEINRYPSQIKATNFCGEHCMFEYRNRERICKGDAHGAWKGGPAKVTCLACGKPFEVRQSQLTRGHGKYCSKDCRYAGHFLIKSCETCGKTMRVKKSHDDRGVARYCSLKCRSIGWVKRGTHAGENAGRYIDGKSQSPEYVRRASHDRRVQKQNNGGSYTLEEWGELCAKYGNKCLCCGKGDVLLTVDHVVPVTKGGGNDISNLQPLCKSCNSRKHNKTVDYR